MSDYNNSADLAEKQLTRISKTMCYAKWSQVSMHLTNGLTHSCYHPPLHKIDIEAIKQNPSALHNTAQKKLERGKMLKGERPEGCAYCWKIEDSGNRSDRIYRSGEYWAQNSRNDIIDALDSGDIIPRYMEVNFNQACNLKCMYCSPHLSTKWEEEIKEYGEFKILDNNGNSIGHNNLDALEEQGLMPLKIKQSENPYLSAFWRWWPALYRNLEVFRITGGEPLMDSNTFSVLDYIYENPNIWLELSITTNMSPPRQELMDRFIESLKKIEEIQIWKDPNRFNPGSGNHWYVNPALKNFALFVSVDSIGNQAEYIRTGLNYSYMQENVQRFLKETNNTTVTFINTFNALSIPKFKEYLQHILELRNQYSKTKQGIKYIPIQDNYNTHPDYEIHPRQRIWFDIPLLRKPEWQAIHVLPVEYASYIQAGIDFMKLNSNVDDFVGFYDFEIAKAERNLQIFLDRSHSTEEKIKIDRKNFVDYFSQHDQRRGTSFTKTFPELEKIYNV
jgi:organic radical activating enzyme